MNKIKAIGTELSAAPVTASEAKELKTRIQESLVEIRQAKKWDEFMDMEDRAEVEILEAKLKSSLTVINQFLATGEWSAPAGAAGGAGSSASGPLPKLAPGWNGQPPDALTVRTDISSDQNLISGAEYAGSVYVEDNDPTQPLEIAFKLSATATDFKAYNRGNDIIYIETYKDSQGNLKKRYWVGKNHVTNVRANIGISAYDLDHGVTIDLSRTYRISDGSNGIAPGTVNGFVVTGSDGYDTIYGSQGGDASRHDVLIGLKGNDKIYGGGGVDEIYGDDNPFYAEERRLGRFGLRQDLQDGDDIIDGGAGKDVIQGGGGRDFGFETDKLNGEQTPAVEEFVRNRNAAPSAGSILGNETRGWEASSTGPGTVEISETDFNGNSVLSLNMPQGYDMAFAEQQGNDLKITYVGTGDGDPPKTFTVIVRGALAPRENSLNAPFTLKFRGNNGANIIDFHDVNFANNAVEIDGAENNDMILAPKNSLSEDGLSMDDLLDRNNRTRASQTRSAIDDIIPENDRTSSAEDEWGSNVNVSFGERQNEIVVKKRDNYSGEAFVRIDPTDEYDKAYAVKDGDDLLVILVNNRGSEPETTVVRIKDYKEFSGDPENTETLSWLILGSTEMGSFRNEDGGLYNKPDAQMTIPLIPLVSGSGGTIRGGTGDDFVFASEQDTVGTDVESDVRGRYAPGEGPDYNPEPEPTTPPASDPTTEPTEPEDPSEPGDDDNAGLP